MFFDTIDELNSTLTKLDQFNDIVFNIWQDKNSEQFKQTELMQLVTFYRTYISELRELSNQLLCLEDNIKSEVADIPDILNDINAISNHPQIEDCLICTAYGETSKDGQSVGNRKFTARREELDDLLSLASERTDLYKVISAHVDETI